MPNELLVAAQSPYLSSGVIQRVRVRIQGREPAFAQEIVDDTNPTDFGKSYIHDSIRLAYEALDFMENNGIM
jgi:hypothetical protein